MSLQIRFGIVGAALGLLIALIGCIIASAPAIVFLWKPLVSLIIGGIIGFILHAVINQFLPELLSDAAGQTSDDIGHLAGQSVNITLPEDGPPIHHLPSGDQADALRETVRKSSYDHEDDYISSDEMAVDGNIIEEVSEDRRSRPLKSDDSLDASFNEAAFYQGVERLPDIGGFSEQFKAGDEADSQAGEAAFTDDSSSVVASVSKKKKDAGSNMNPELLARAIQTALKKEDR